MSAANVKGRTMRAEESDSAPREDEYLNPPDVLRCYRSQDVADRALEAGVDAAVNLCAGWHGKSRVAFVCVHMLVSAIAYAADRLAEAMAQGRVAQRSSTNTDA